MQNLIPFPEPSATPTIQPMPRFPLDCLPPTIRTFIQRSSQATRVPPEMIAAPFLAFTGAIIGSQLRFEITPGWSERPVLWIALVATTGSGKSPAIRAARGPLDILQTEIYEQWRLNMHTWAAQTENTEPEPTLTHLFTTDSTSEALTQEFAHRNGLVLLIDELHGIIRSQSRGGGNERQKFLSLWSSEAIAPIRKHSAPVYVENPVVTVVGGLQPLLLHKFRSREHDGFIERFLPIFVVNHQHNWEDLVSSQPSPPDAKSVAEILSSLLQIETPEPDTQGSIVRMTPAATNVWAECFNRNAEQQNAAHLELKGFYAKLPAHLARIALVLHALWNPQSPTDPISETTMRHAVTLTEFFRIHIRNIQPILIKNIKAPVAKLPVRQRILQALAQTKAPDGWLTRTELARAIGNPPMGEFDLTMTILVGTDQLEDRKRTIPGSRKPRYEFRLPR